MLFACSPDPQSADEYLYEGKHMLRVSFVFVYIFLSRGGNGMLFINSNLSYVPKMEPWKMERAKTCGFRVVHNNVDPISVYE